MNGKILIVSMIGSIVARFCGVNGADSNSTATVDDYILEALLAMLELFLELDGNYSSEYATYIDDYNKSSSYIFDGSDNYTGLAESYAAYVNTSVLIEALNADYPRNFTYYETDSESGNVSTSLPVVLVGNTTSLFSHSYFSDLTDSQRESYTGAEDESSYESGSWGCTINSDLGGFGSTYQFSTSVCGYNYNQQTYGTCWAFASTNQFQCNYNLAHGTSIPMAAWPCYTSLCIPSCGSASGGWPTCANAYFVSNGFCPYTSYPNYPYYPACMSQSCQGCNSGGLLTANTCYEVNVQGSTWWNFLATSRLLSNNIAVSFSVKVGSNFQQLWNKGAITSNTPALSANDLCGNFVGYHAMTVVGVQINLDPNMGSWVVQNSWGDDWGWNGYFLMSIDAYAGCVSGPISYNQFTVSSVDDDESSGHGDRPVFEQYFVVSLVMSFLYFLFDQ